MKKFITLIIFIVVSSYNLMAQNARRSNYLKNYKLKTAALIPKQKSALTQNLDTIYISPLKTLIVAFTNNQKIAFLNMDCNQISNEIINEGTAIALKLKTPLKGFEETNVVVNSNNKYYGYLIRYVSDQREIVHYLDPTNSLEKQAKAKQFVSPISSEANINNTLVSNTSESIKANSFVDTKVKKMYDSASKVILKKDESDGKYTDEKGDCKFALLSTHVYKDKLYFAVRITNNSSISYDIDFIKFGTKFIKKSKNQAEQETEISPVYEYNSGTNKIQSGGVIEKVFVFDKFTIDGKTKKFKVEAWEKNGERPLTIFYPSDKITNSDLL
jgi:hypothetical protein